jgi:hypothetical protein
LWKKDDQEGRNEGGYRCSRAKSTQCWNKATALRQKVHDAIREAVVAWLLSLDHELTLLSDSLRLALADSVSEQSDWLAALEIEVMNLDSMCKSLIDAIELAHQQNQKPERLLSQLMKREEELARTQAEIARLTSPATNIHVPTRAELIVARDELVQRLTPMDRASGVWLQRLTEKIEAVPFQQFKSNKVVLRARFELDVLGLLPESLLAHVTQDMKVALSTKLPKKPLVVDLFDMPVAPKHGIQALALREQGMTLKQVGLALGYDARTAKRNANVAIDYGRQMRAAEITDPYQELTERPSAASRWRTHARFHDAKREEQAA